MSKIRIYLEKDKLKPVIRISDKDICHKLKHVLRLNLKEKVFIFDGQGEEFSYWIRQINKKDIVLEKENLTVKSLRCKHKLILGFPLMRENKMDMVFQKATELGASGFIPFISQHSAVKKKKSRNERWRK